MNTPTEVRILEMALGSLRLRDEAAMGAKAARLGEAAALGLAVPPGFAVAPEAMRMHLAQRAVQDRLGKAMQEAQSAGPGAFAEAAEAVRAAVQGTPVPAEVADAVRAAYEKLCEAQGDARLMVAVRLSAPGASPSLPPRLGVAGPDEVVAQVRALWADLCTPEALRAAAENTSIGPAAVIVQALVPCESAGTAVPGRDGRITIRSAWGLANLAAPSDRFVVDAATLSLAASEVVHKPSQWLPAPGGAARREVVDPERAEAPSLTPEEAIRLAEVTLQLGAHLGSPQEVGFALEWVGSSRRIRILQVTPVASPEVPSAREPRRQEAADPARLQHGAGPARIGIPPVQSPPSASMPPAPHSALAHVFVEAPAMPAKAIAADGLVAESLYGRHAESLPADGLLLPGDTVLASLPGVDGLAALLAEVAQAMAPRPVVYRFAAPTAPDSVHGGCRQALADPALLRLQCQAVRKVRDQGGRNLHVMLPSVRTMREFQAAKRFLDAEGLHRGRDLRLWMACDVPGTAVTIDRFLEEGVDGVCIDVRTLPSLALGIDRLDDSQDVYDGHNPAVLRLLQQVLRACAGSAATMVAGLGPNEGHVLAFLVREGVDAVAVAPADLGATRHAVALAERNLILDGLRNLRGSAPPVPATPRRAVAPGLMAAEAPASTRSSRHAGTPWWQGP